MGFLFRCLAPAAMPGDDLLFQRLSVSTIGAVWFHGRVRDGIGWGTDAMVTKQCSRRNLRNVIDAFSDADVLSDVSGWKIVRHRTAAKGCRSVGDGGILQA